MGRVDEAMRRAAEAGARRKLDLVADAPLAVPGSGVGTDLPLADPFPTEQPERPRLRSVAPAVTQPAGDTPTGTRPRPAPSLLPPLSDRIKANLNLGRKVVIDAEMAPASREQYRRLATGLHAAQAASGLKVVMIASALASEGKTLTAANLSLTLSESYQRNVLLIDGDLRRPSQHTLFGLPIAPGLSEGLLSPDDRKLPLHHVSAKLTVLTAGEPTGEPMAALASERMHRLVQEAREMFDWVIVDTPPIGLLSDANLLAEFADGAILVVKAESTSSDLVVRAMTTLGKDRILGVVLNRATVPSGPGYRYDGYYQGSKPSPPRD